jgi:hypothetical protein
MLIMSDTMELGTSILCSYSLEILFATEEFAYSKLVLYSLVTLFASQKCRVLFYVLQ